MQGFTGIDRAVVVNAEATGLAPNVDRIVSGAPFAIPNAALFIVFAPLGDRPVRWQAVKASAGPPRARLRG